MVIRGFIWVFLLMTNSLLMLPNPVIYLHPRYRMAMAMCGKVDWRQSVVNCVFVCEAREGRDEGMTGSQ